MYQLDTIIEALKGVVGWDSEGYALPASVQESESGLTFQMAHPLVTIPNIDAIMRERDNLLNDDYLLHYPNGGDPAFPEWQESGAYKAGDKVALRGVYYIANKEASAGTNPAEDIADGGKTWKVYSTMGDYLAKLTRTGITQVVQRFLAEKKIRNESKALLEHRTFFDGAGRLSATLQKHGRVVGYEITPVRGAGVAMWLNRVGLQFRTDRPFDLPIYLFHSSKAEAVQKIVVRYDKVNGTFQWADYGDTYCPYTSDEVNAGGSWYLCYWEGDLPITAEAINMTKDWSREPCSTCGISNLRAWRELTKYVQISPFYAPVDNQWGEHPQLWDIEQNIYTCTTNYGLNVELTIGCDITPFIVRQRSIFADVIEKQVAYNLLRTMSMNPDVRVNRNQNNVGRMDVLYELDGDTRGRRGGLGAELDKAYAALEIDTQGMDRICLTCNNYGVRYTTT